MSEDKPNKVLSANVRLPSDLLRELRKERARYNEKGEEAPPFGDMLMQAWTLAREYRLKDNESTGSSVTVHDTVLAYTQPVDTDPPNPVADAPPSKDRVPTSQSELGVEIWVQMLRYILDHGDADTQAAITKNLERFHLLARLLNREVAIEPSTPIPQPNPDIQKGMERMREFGKKYPGSGSDSGEHESGVRPDVLPDTRRIGKRGKH